MFGEIKQELKNLKADKRSLRDFGILFFGAWNILALIFYFKQRDFWPWSMLAGFLFLFLGLVLPSFLNPLYRAWMALSFTLGWIVTRIILVLAFYLIFTPMGLILKIFGKDLLDLKIDKSQLTYWKKSEVVSDKSRHKKQF